MDIAKIITWLVSGAIAGYFVGWILTGRREGFGIWKNLLFGLAGGFLGGYLFVELLKVDPLEFKKISINLQDIVAAILGTLIVLIGLKLLGRGPKKKT